MNFRETIFWPVRAAASWNFYTHYSSLNCLFSRTCGAGQPHVWLCPYFYLTLIKWKEQDRNWAGLCVAVQFDCFVLFFIYIFDVLYVTDFIREKMSDERSGSFTSSNSPVQFSQVGGQPMVRWTSSDLETNSKLELIRDSSAVRLLSWSIDLSIKRLEELRVWGIMALVANALLALDAPVHDLAN